jgi:hypothetical protein
VRGSIRLAAQCHCVPVNSDVRAHGKMVIEPRSAGIFIAEYTRLLLEVHRLAGGQASSNILQMLAFGRDAVGATPYLLARAISSLEEQGERIVPDVSGRRNACD